MNMETEAIKAMLGQIIVQLDPDTRTKFVDTFYRLLQTKGNEILEDEMKKDYSSFDEMMNSFAIQGIVAVGLIGIQDRVDWEQIKNSGLSVVK